MSSISQVAELLDISAHTLRYYEKIGLLAPISKNASGHRQYEISDIERVRFIQRAQRMQFSLQEIRQLAHIDRTDSNERPYTRNLVKDKLTVIEQSLKDLKLLKKDLNQMLNSCISSKDDEDCPILVGIDDTCRQ